MKKLLACLLAAAMLMTSAVTTALAANAPAAAVSTQDSAANAGTSAAYSEAVRPQALGALDELPTREATKDNTWSFETPEEVRQWYTYDAVGDGDGWSVLLSDGRYAAYHGAGMMQSAASSDNNGFNFALNVDQWLISPAFTGNKWLSINYCNPDGAEHPQALSLYITTDEGATWKPIQEITVDSNQWSNRMILISSYQNEVAHLAFRHTGTEGGTGILLDKVQTYNGMRPPAADIEEEELFGWHFEQSEVMDIITSWRVVDDDGDNQSWVPTLMDPYYTAYDGNGLLISESWDRDAQAPLKPNNLAIMPEFEGAYLTFWFCSLPKSPTVVIESLPQKAVETTAGEELGIYVSTDNGETWSPELYHFVGTPAYEQYYVDLSDYEGQKICVGFRHYGTEGLGAAAIDCIEVGDKPISIDNPAKWGNFDNNVGVSIWTKTDDDKDGYSWQWDRCSLEAQSGFGMMYSEADTKGSVDNWLVSPLVKELPENYRFRVYAWGGSVLHADEKFGLYVSTDNGLKWTKLEEFTATAEQTLYSADLSEYAGKDIRVAVRHNGSDGYRLNVDSAAIVSNTEPDPTPVPEEPDTFEPQFPATEPPTEEPVPPATEEPNPAEYAFITLTVDDANGMGYQLLLDSQAQAVDSGIIEDSELFFTEHGPAAPQAYEMFDHKIPYNADGNPATTHVVTSGSVTIAVPEGTYDWCITRPEYDSRIALPDTEYGNSPIVADDFFFEAGCTYEFTVKYIASAAEDAVYMDITPTDVTAPEGHNDSVWDFEQAYDVTQFTLRDDDEDGETWKWMYGSVLKAPEGKGMMVSYSDSDIDDVLGSDHWLITPKFQNTAMEFILAATADTGEKISAYVSTDGGSSFTEKEIAVFEAAGESKTCLIDLTEYAGKEICVALRHHGTDSSTAVLVDNIIFKDAAVETPSDNPTENPTETPTEAPATEVPATEVPATEVPATEVPATETPTEAPTTAPATEPPATDEPTPTPTADDGIPGDADGNGTVEIEDALKVMRHALGLETLPDAAAELCDMNGDGSILVADALTIARIALGIA